MSGSCGCLWAPCKVLAEHICFLMYALQQPLNSVTICLPTPDILGYQLIIAFRADDSWTDLYWWGLKKDFEILIGLSYSLSLLNLSFWELGCVVVMTVTPNAPTPRWGFLEALRRNIREHTGRVLLGKNSCFGSWDSRVCHALQLPILLALSQ